MADDAETRLRARREYIRLHTQARRDVAREKGDRRLDVTLKDDALDDYLTVRRYIEASELSPTDSPRRKPRSNRRISDVYVVNWRSRERPRESDRMRKRRGTRCSPIRHRPRTRKTCVSP
jgi:hypothetical protein